MKWLELPALWLVNVPASLLIALSMVAMMRWRLGELRDDWLVLQIFWLFAWGGSGLVAVVWYIFRRNRPGWSYLEGLGWSAVGFGLAAGSLITLVGGGSPGRKIEKLAELSVPALLYSLPAIVLIAPFTVKLWAWVLRRTRGGA